MGVQNPNSTSYEHPDEPNLLNLHKAMQYDAAGRPVVRTNNFLLDVSRGVVPGHTNVFFGGRNRSVSNNTEATCWNVGGLYPWAAWNGGAGTLTLVSDSALDTDIVILLDGLDANYAPQTEVITVNDGTTVTSTKSFIRLNSATNIGSKACVGTINIRRNGVVIGQIKPDKQSTSMAIYTVPAGYTAFSVWGEFAILGTASAEVRAYWRFPGGVFVGVYATEVTETSYQSIPPLPGRIPEKTDIDNRVAQGTNNLTASSNQQLILIKNDYL
jgi:hypothetical protein